MFSPPSETIKIYYQITDGTTDEYPQAIIYNSAGVAQSTINLSHLTNGLYSGSGTAPGITGDFIIQKRVYSNSGRTSPVTTRDIISESLEIDLKSKVGPGGMAITSKDIISLLKPLQETIAQVQEDLALKSEFNPEVHTVQANIPKTSLITLKEQLENSFKEIRDYSPELKQIIEKINSLPTEIPEIIIPKTDLTPVIEQGKNLQESISGTVEIIKNLIGSIKIDSTDLKTLNLIKGLDFLENVMTDIQKSVTETMDKVEDQEALRKVL